MKSLFVKFGGATIFAVLSIAFLATTVLAKPASTFAFNPNLQGTIAITDSNNDQLQQVHLHAEGDVAGFSQTGQYIYDADAHLHVQHSAPNSLEGKGSFTGQNGDRIDFNFQVNFTPAPTDSQYPYHFTGKFQVTGGAGKYENASGNGDITAGGYNPTTGAFFGNWSAQSLRAPLLA